MKSLCIAVVHNGQADRLAHVLPCVEALRGVLRDRMSVSVREVSFQPGIEPHTIPMALLRKVIYEILRRQWELYRKVESAPAARHVASVLKYSAGRIFKKTGDTARWQRNSAVEMLVTAKHIRAWEGFVDSGADYLLVFEDDVVFLLDSLERFSEVLVPALMKNHESGLYADLAGGLDRALLRVDALEVGHDGSFREYSLPTTNTACCYLLDQSLAKQFCSELTRSPLLRLIGIDWLMNKLFVSLAARQIYARCLHADPPIFRHGSFAGRYPSWQEYT